LLCRAHNQFEAEKVFGRVFMEGRREQARARADGGDGANEAQARVEAEAQELAEANEQLLDVVAALKLLGFRVERARWAAEAARVPGATLEQHIRAALKLLRPRSVTVTPSTTPAAA
jgi:hypothetical protein